MTVLTWPLMITSSWHNEYIMKAGTLTWPLMITSSWHNEYIMKAGTLTWSIPIESNLLTWPHILKGITSSVPLKSLANHLSCNLDTMQMIPTSVLHNNSGMRSCNLLTWIFNKIMTLTYTCTVCGRAGHDLHGSRQSWVFKTVMKSVGD